MLRKPIENNVDTYSTDLDIVDQSFNMRPNESFQIGNTETVDVTSVLNQLEMDTEQNRRQRSDGRVEPRVWRCEEEVERLLTVEFVVGSNEPNDGRVPCVKCGKKLKPESMKSH